MSLATFASLLLALFVSLASAALLARFAPRLSWVDGPGGPDAGRKLQTRAVPTIGGTAILLGLSAGWIALEISGASGAHAIGIDLESALAQWVGAPVELAVVPALCAAFAVGLADDLAPRGLSPSWKLAGQAFAGAILAAPCWGATPAHAGTMVALGLVLAAVVAQNALNTFDNSDGAAASLSFAALALPSPLLAASVLGFLPFNLRLAARKERGAVAYLGDSGSHLLGLALLLAPASWPALFLPLLDLARVSVERVLAGARPWVGDRRHLAHRFLARGLSSVESAAWLFVIASPSLVMGALAWREKGSRGWMAHAAGPALTSILYVIALAWTRRPSRPRAAGSVRGASSRSEVG